MQHTNSLNIYNLENFGSSIVERDELKKAPIGHMAHLVKKNLIDPQESIKRELKENWGKYKVLGSVCSDDKRRLGDKKIKLKNICMLSPSLSFLEKKIERLGERKKTLIEINYLLMEFLETKSQGLFWEINNIERQQMLHVEFNKYEFDENILDSINSIEGEIRKNILDIKLINIELMNGSKEHNQIWEHIYLLDPFPGYQSLEDGKKDLQAMIKSRESVLQRDKSEIKVKKLDGFHLSGLESKFEMFMETGDKEGLFLLFSTMPKDLYPYNNLDLFKKMIIDVIIGQQIEKLEILLGIIPLSQFQLEECQIFFSTAFRLGRLEMIDLLVKNGLNIPEKDFENLYSFSEWLKGEAEITVPALNFYKQLDKALSSDHHALYGGKEVQETYQTNVKESVLYALWEMNRAKDDSQSFETLLTALGERRRHIAHVCNTKNAKYFGMRRLCVTETSLINQYQVYLDRYEHHKIIEVVIEDQKFVVTRHTKNCAPDDVFGSGPLRPTISHMHYKFWEKDSPLFTHVASIYEKIILEDWSSKPHELKDEIAKLHWHLANIVPFVRGSASISETITDALWLFHGFIPQAFEQGKSLDLEALVEPDLTKFQDIYPMAISIR